MRCSEPDHPIGPAQLGLARGRSSRSTARESSVQSSSTTASSHEPATVVRSEGSVELRLAARLCTVSTTPYTARLAGAKSIACTTGMRGGASDRRWPSAATRSHAAQQQKPV
eukprot:scaffold257569_cov32-Tisochrysis_lutea.AAC.1